MAKVEKPRITWKKVHPLARAPEVDGAGGLLLSTIDSIDFYSGHRALLHTGLALVLPGGYCDYVDMAGVMAARGICYALDHGPAPGGFSIHVFHIAGDFLRIVPGDVVARLMLVPVVAVELVEEAP